MGGHLLFAVKANQPELAADVALLFDRPPPGEVFVVARSHGGMAVATKSTRCGPCRR